MNYKIETLTEKKLAGIRMAMSFANNKTHALWQSFMTRRKEITNQKGTELYSLQNYPPLFFENFSPHTPFEKWATTEVGDFETIPEGMETFTLRGGLYAVFFFKGASNTGAAAFQYIMGTWMPSSGYQLDNGTHFEILGEKYRNNDPDSEEEIWIPIKPKDAD